MQTGYPAARAVAATVVDHLAAHLAAARERGFADVAPQPDAETIAALVDLAFWASLQREEGRAPKISLAFVPPEAGTHAMVFERALAADPRGLARVAPAAARPGIHLGVGPDGGALRVWGTPRSVPLLAFVIEVVEPGLLVLKQRGGDELDKYGTIAVL